MNITAHSGQSHMSFQLSYKGQALLGSVIWQYLLIALHISITTSVERAIVIGLGWSNTLQFTSGNILGSAIQCEWWLYIRENTKGIFDLKHGPYQIYKGHTYDETREPYFGNWNQESFIGTVLTCQGISIVAY